MHTRVVAHAGAVCQGHLAPLETLHSILHYCNDLDCCYSSVSSSTQRPPAADDDACAKSCH